ncbi:response regulator [Flavobacterium sp. PL002]|uniref:response regulator n=1 Tax=Flavobacterium sp. PL002 TaxID=1897058 RepID=UPI001787E414|nr:response regulator [Flavobacterium sp. PL002]MBE0392427.1 Response regulator rcp1 [Flavobacterium sp. PL002]
MRKLLLADDDMDDCLFFQEAIDELELSINVTVVKDGVVLMDFLKCESVDLPDVLFLDLNMPRKSGFECLSEIKQLDSLKEMPVIIFSTSFDLDVINKLYDNGAHYYIRKPGDFEILKKIIFEASKLLANNKIEQPERKDFIVDCR